MNLTREVTDPPVTLALLAVLFGLVGFGFSFVVTNPYSRTLPVAAVVAGGVYLATRDADHRPFSLDVPLAALLSLYLVVLAAALVVYQVEGSQRTMTVHLLVVVCYGVTALVALTPTSASLTLGLVAMTGVVQRGLAYYASPLYLGNDVFAHNRIVGEVVASNSMAPLATSKYYYAPFYHLLVAVQRLFADVSVRHAAFVTVSVVLVVVPAASLYLIVGRVWGEQAALLGALLYTASDFANHWAITPQVTSLGVVFFVIAFLLLVSSVHTDRESYRLFYLLAFVAVTLTHQVSTVITFLCVTIFLAVWTAVEPAFRRRAAWLVGATLAIVLVDFQITKFGGPASDSRSFIATVLGIWQTSLSEATLPGGGASGPAADVGVTLAGSAALSIWHVAGTGILLGLGILGGLHWLSTERVQSGTGLAFGAIVSVLFPAVLAGPVVDLRFLIPWRWFAFIYVPLAILAASGLVRLLEVVADRTGGTSSGTSTFAVIAVVVLLIGPYAFLMGGNSIGARDGPPLDDVPGAERYAVTAPEVSTVEYAVENVPETMPLLGDFMIAHNVLERHYGAENARTITMEEPRPAAIAENETAILVNRSYMQSGHVKFRFGTGTGIGNERGSLVHGVVPVRQMDATDREVIYSTGTTELVRLSPTPAGENQSAP